MNYFKNYFWVIVLLCITKSFAQIEPKEEVKDVAKEAQNPLTNVISLPFQNYTDFGIGEYDKTLI